MAKEPTATTGRANTPEVDDWLAKSAQLTAAAISLAGNPSVDAATSSMMRQVQAGCMVLLTALQRLPPVAPEPPQ
jgi:hypothetical protein